MATGDLFRDSETGAIQRLVRDDGDKVYVSDPGRESEMRSMSKEDFEAGYEQVSHRGGFRPVASSHSMAVETSRLEKATREGDEEEAEEAAENIMLNNDASPSELEETYIESEETPEGGEFAPDLDAVEDDLPEAPEAEDDEADDMAPAEPGAGETPAPTTVTNEDQG